MSAKLVHFSSARFSTNHTGKESEPRETNPEGCKSFEDLCTFIWLNSGRFDSVQKIITSFRNIHGLHLSVGLIATRPISDVTPFTYKDFELQLSQVDQNIEFESYSICEVLNQKGQFLGLVALAHHSDEKLDW